MVLRLPASGPYDSAQQNGRFTQFCMWADANGFSPIEYLLPAIEVETVIRPYAFETRGASYPPPSLEALKQHEPWHYKIDFANDVTTRIFKLDEEWLYHHYRAATSVELAHRLFSADAAQTSVLDVGCHCGVLALEFAGRGFGAVRGIDLRHENIEQAKFLAQEFRLDNAEFEQRNARDLRLEKPADVVFCGGLLYHVTFPQELMADLAALTKDVLIFETLCSTHPFSGFHYISGKDIKLSLEGETSIEFMPTYRVVIDLLHSVGFKQVYEVLGSARADVPFFKSGNVRTFIAARDDSPRLRDFVERLGPGGVVGG